MNTGKQVLLIVGSPRGARSTSERLGHYFVERLQQRGMAVQRAYLQRALRSETGKEEWLKVTEAADLLIFAFPLYADSLPAGVIRALELLREQRKNRPLVRRQSMMGIVNCGFAEAYHNDPALAILERFSKENNIVWLGGLALGMGGMLNGRPLEKFGGMLKNVTGALDLAAKAFSLDRPLPKEAIQGMAKPLMPKWLYLMMANIDIKRTARKHGARDINARPYERG